jgi:radical SAM superfamily enzyme with C-terminal helix-hairpin-helix motif
MQKKNVVILDCYTDEPSGYGVRPYLGTHQINLSQALAYIGIEHKFLTIDDLRFVRKKNSALEIFNVTRNCKDASSILRRADIVYIIWGCFVQYEYFSCVPARASELVELLDGIKASKILFYVLGAKADLPSEFKHSKLNKIVDFISFDNPYRYVLEGSSKRSKIESNYSVLDKIAEFEVPIIYQLKNPVIAEIETASGCDFASCSFCIEANRKTKVSFRDYRAIVKQVKSLYNVGVRNFRLGRQPNFYFFERYDPHKIELLLSGIRQACPEIETLHIDNVNPLSVLDQKGQEITKVIAKYCTSGNIAAFGIESFDNKVREGNKIRGDATQVLKAIEIINRFGRDKCSDGFFLYLPGINLIHGLPGQNRKSHKRNLQFLEKILKEGLHTGRLYYRKLTHPTGVGFVEHESFLQDFELYFEEIVNSFVLPMQKEVYKPNSILKNFREVIKSNNGFLLRRLGTCSIKARVSTDKELIPYDSYNVRVKGTCGNRILDTQLIEYL